MRSWHILDPISALVRACIYQLFLDEVRTNPGMEIFNLMIYYTSKMEWKAIQLYSPALAWSIWMCTGLKKASLMNQVANCEVGAIVVKRRRKYRALVSHLAQSSDYSPRVLLYWSIPNIAGPAVILSQWRVYLPSSRMSRRGAKTWMLIILVMTV